MSQEQGRITHFAMKNKAYEYILFLRGI